MIIELGVQKQTNNKFNHNDLTNALFLNIQPSIIIKPFSDIPHINIQNIIIPSYLYIPIESPSIKDVVKNAISNDTICKELMKMPPWILGRFVEKYKKEMTLWTNYVLNELPEFCKTFESKLNWSTFKYINTRKKLTTEKMLWIYFCTTAEKDEQFEFVDKIRESLLPWFNYELWQNVEKYKNNRRENTQFEEIKNKIISSTIVDDSDLDIIE